MTTGIEEILSELDVPTSPGCQAWENDLPVCPAPVKFNVKTGTEDNCCEQSALCCDSHISDILYAIKIGGLMCGHGSTSVYVNHWPI